MSRWLLVELHEDLAELRTSRYGVWCGIHILSGVKSITDMELVPQSYLDELLMPESETYAYKARERRKAKRKSQV